jgi:hypothetical protein
MKKGVIVYHNNIDNLYPKRWVDKSINSMINQSDNDFIFYELNYGGKNNSVIPTDNKLFWSKKLLNYAEAMNFLLDRAFEDNCEYVFNTNLDDFYDLKRIELQLDLIIKNNLHLVSSDFCYVEEKQNANQYEDVITKILNITKYDIKKNLDIRHNVIAHPAVCYSKKFWNDSSNRYNINKTPEEDLDLWIRSINNGYRFGIHEKVLLYYRIHTNQVSNK